ncbi:MAG: hypothetical protein WC007_00340 [Pelobacteraceae bacterium]
MIRNIFFTGIAVILLSLGVVTRSHAVCGTPGKDGPMPALAANSIVNAYYAGTGSPAAGTTSVTVGAVVTTTGGQNLPINPGDLLLIIQMQDANINATNTAAYGGSGTGTGYTTLNSTGRYEFVVATNTVTTAGGTITVSSPLANSYRTGAYVAGSNGARRFQVIRVPQYSSATMSGSLSAPVWTSATGIGGVVAIDVAGQLNWNGRSINVTGLGFRGGGGRSLTGGTGADTDYRTLSSVANNAQKGEGIAGTSNRVVTSTGTVINTASEGYPNGSHARGAPGNAGGGGTDGNQAANDENTGGGGGAGFGAGGKGGNAWSSAVASGGFGGSGVPMSASLLTMGGGGGAGTTNNATGTPASGQASSGATGGGIAFVRAGSITGSGTISANGNDGNSTVCNDGSGGGGGGGSVVVVASGGAGSVGALTVHANGGKGGDNLQAACNPGTTTAHGPGGGGGGGYVALSGTATINVAGGANGVTVGSAAFGATPGIAGSSSTAVSAVSVPGAGFGAACYPQLTVAKSTSTPTAAKGGTATYTITATNAATAGWATGLKVYDYFVSPPSPPYPGGTPFAPFTYAATTAPTPTLAGTGASRSTTPVNPAAGSNQPAWGDFTIPPGGSVVITFNATIPAATGYGLYQNNGAVFYNDPTRTTAGQVATPGGTYQGGGTAAGTNYDPASSTLEDVAIWAPSPTIAKAFAPGTVVTGSGVSTMTFTLSNSNAFALTNVNFTDTLTGFKVRNGTIGGTCVGTTNSPPLAADATSLNLTVPSLPVAGCTITIPVYSTIAGNYTNTTSGVGSSESGPVSRGTPSNTASLSFFAPLVVTKVPSVSTATPGALVSYTIGYSNPNSSAILKDLVISDPVPLYSTYQSASCGPLPSGITACNVSFSPPPAGNGNGIATWTLPGDLNPGASGTVQLSVTIQ